MAGRFLFQKLASRMSRSTSLLGAHASSPVTRRASLGRHLSTLHCIRTASFRSNPPKGSPPVITDRIEPSLVDYVRANGTIYWEHKLSAREAEWQARREAAIAASKAECAAWDAKWKAKDAAFDRYVMIILGSWCFIGLVFNSMLDSASSRDGKGQSGSHFHSGAARVNSSVQNPEIQ